jgi:hypothetical protein
LFCPFHGSIKPGKTPLPVFRLYDLNIPNQPNLLCFSDRLLQVYEEENLELGWYLDTKNVKQQSTIEKITLHYAKLVDAKNIIFFGTSGGGFLSVLMASRLGQTAVVSNSQFFLEKHPAYYPLVQVLKKTKML